MKVINVAFAGDMDEATASVVSQKMKQEIEEVGTFSIGTMDVATNKDKITEFVKSAKYDVVICQENIRGAAIGEGSIKAWKKENPTLIIILLLDIQKKGGVKLENLLKKAFYYDAVYVQDANGKVLSSIIENGRTREDTIVYYGLEGRMDEQETLADVIADVKDALPAEPVVEDVKKEEVIEEPVPEESVEQIENDIESAMGSFENIFEEKVSVEKEEVAEPAVMEEEVKEQDVKGADVSAGEDMWSDFDFGSMQEEEAPIVAEAKPEPVVAPSSSKPVADVATSTVTVSGQRNIFAPVKANILSVMSQNVMLIRFDEALSFGRGESVQNYRMVIMVNSGVKGHVENGQYVSGMVSISAYGNCLVDANTVVAETPEHDLFTLGVDLQGAQCNVLLFRI